MSSNLNDTDNASEMDYLREEAEKVQERMDVVATNLGDDPDIEKADQMSKANAHIEKILALADRESVPTDDEMDSARAWLKQAQMHADEAEPAFPVRHTGEHDDEEDDDYS